jgi:thiosulfate/3-mercaptopyruvate sulfurtransferase
MSEKVLITPAELSDMIKSESVVVIDTRDPATYERRSPAGRRQHP